MLQLVAGFLMVPGSIKFLIPPGSTYFTRVDAVTTGDPHGSSWQVEDAHASLTVSRCHRPRFSMQHRPVTHGLCDLSRRNRVRHRKQRPSVAHGAMIITKGPNMFDAEKVVNDKQILEEILRTTCAEKGASAYGHLWSL